MENIRVFVRVKPPAGTDASPLTIGDNSLMERSGAVYDFDAVFDSWTQEDVFANTAESTVETAFSGYNSTIFAYGQTGSGKTYTMQGEGDDREGIIPRTIRYIYGTKRPCVSVRCSFIEIYNEKVTDLLSGANGLSLRESGDSGVVVDGMLVEGGATVEEALDLYYRGATLRKTTNTHANEKSSRSHSIFTLHVTVSSELGISRVSKINLVDLAGSERIHPEHADPASSFVEEKEEKEEAKRVKTAGGKERAQETGSINRSLLCLGRVINVLADNHFSQKQSHVNYRDSKLTFLLKDSLGGNSKLVVMGMVNPSPKCLGETRNTLKFLGRVKLIKVSPVVNTEVSRSSGINDHIRRLFEENSRLHTENTALEEKLKLLQAAEERRGEKKENQKNAQRINEGAKKRAAELEQRFQDGVQKTQNSLKKIEEMERQVDAQGRAFRNIHAKLIAALRHYRTKEIDEL